MDKVDNRRGVIKGRSDKYQTGLNADETAMLFDKLYAIVEQYSKLSQEDKADLKTEIEELRQELGKKEKANETFLLRRLRNIKRMAPDILEVTLATIANPAAGFGLVAKKIADEFRASAG